MRSKLLSCAMVLFGFFLTASPARATTISFYLGVDDHGSLTINGTNYITLNCGGSCSSMVRLTMCTSRAFARET